MNKALAQQALDDINELRELVNYEGWITAIGNKSITALTAALAEPSAEPVKYLCDGTRFKMSFFEDDEDECGNKKVYVTCFCNFERELDGRWVALVAAENDCHLTANNPPVPPSPSAEPVGWKGLSDVQWMNIVNKHDAWFGWHARDVAHEVAKLTEEKLRAINTHPPVQPSPLSDEEIIKHLEDVADSSDSDMIAFARAIEAAIRSKT